MVKLLNELFNNLNVDEDGFEMGDEETVDEWSMEEDDTLMLVESMNNNLPQMTM